jgi:vacuolar iron transporter family protein
MTLSGTGFGDAVHLDRIVFMRRAHSENHLVSRIGLLRAAVLGANDGIISTASLILGVASASASSGQAVLSGIAGLVAGAMSMAAGKAV